MIKAEKSQTAQALRRNAQPGQGQPNPAQKDLNDRLERAIERFRNMREEQRFLAGRRV
ncbi:MAG: hypothetical protein AAGJ28_03595 [Pseudomonadota bacterium]